MTISTTSARVFCKKTHFIQFCCRQFLADSTKQYSVDNFDFFLQSKFHKVLKLCLFVLYNKCSDRSMEVKLRAL